MSHELTPKQHFEQELGVISFIDLQKFFAKGIVLIAAESMDVIETALAINEDDAEKVQAWVNCGHLIRANDDHARAWLAEESVFKAVTVAPWVLVQEVTVSEADLLNYKKETK
ncbi:DUF2288 family protein [Marinicella rhabdoformis]|uniref:DUF2288 family protein n=1 Tax=Marinicella rhabdoformis TaxID=2580566 RepID=UPI0012AEDA1B|nr:DUF2288 family protein [Marinicella rhabdoformis]